MNRLPWCFRALVLLAVCTVSMSWARSPGDIPAEEFFRWAKLQAPVLSPDGTRIAMIVPGPEGRTVVVVADVKTPDKRVGVAQFKDADVRGVWWVNDRRLIFNAIDYQSALGEQYDGGLYAVDTDGSNFIWLVARGHAEGNAGHVASRPLRWSHRLSLLLRDGSDDIVVQRLNVFDDSNDAGSVSPLRLNTRTRAVRSLVPDEPRHAADWAFNAKGEPLAVRSIERDGTTTVWWHADTKAPWTQLGKYSLFDDANDGLAPLAVTHDGQLLVRALRRDAARTSALYRFDPATNRLEAKALIGLENFDFDGVPIFDRVTGVLVGASFTSDATGVAWLDAGLVEVQKRIDSLLPNTANVFSCDPCHEQRFFVVTAWSDRQAPVYFVFDRQATGKASLALIGPSRPGMDASLMAEQHFQRIPSRDGKSIPVYVTKPQGKGPWPTVVLVHGGPWVHGASWGWDAESQFLASRGYLVVEPAFRGSTGYGDTWYRASFKQWGLGMQDDVTDATRWAVAQGMADPKRLAIAGASYGGYATMMGLVKEPDLYRAGINWLGVTDIDLMYSVGWSDSSGSLWQREGMPRRVGDSVKDAAQLRQTSPLLRANEITKPVLMAYGGKDLRVPLPHGTKMRDALRKSGKAEVEWIEYELEGHGFLLTANRVDFWTRVEKFLGQHLR